MPPRPTLPRSIHLPSTPPLPLPHPPPGPSHSPQIKSFLPKPHLRNFARHLDSNPSSSSSHSQSHPPLPPSSSPLHPSSSSTSHFIPPTSPFAPPTAPQLPPRRRPAFSPGGFGLGGSHPGSGPGTGAPTTGRGRSRKKDAAVGSQNLNIIVNASEMERIGREEARMEGRDKDEAEACYVPPPATLLHYSHTSLPLVYSPHPLPSYQLAYETWGALNSDASNAIILHTGLSASSHVASSGNLVSKSTSSKPGWWEDFVGPGKSIDTNKFFVICTNVLGGCFGSTGPSSPYPPGDGQTRWATRFPLLSIHDMARAQLGLLDDLGIEKVYASIGSSMGGMTSLSMAYLAPERVGRVASISATGRAGLGGVGMRYAQRSVLMADPNWNRGFYYDGVPPHNGMKLARQIATITYRSGPEWEQRFGRRMLSEAEDMDAKSTTTTTNTNGELGHNPGVPRLSPDFLIETYLDHQGERFCLTYDANSLIYLSKAMDLFDMTAPALKSLANKFNKSYPSLPPFPLPSDPTTVSASSSFLSHSNSTSSTDPTSSSTSAEALKKKKERFIPTSKSPHLPELAEGLQRLANIPALVLGVQSDVLFPVEQQRELADALKLAGNNQVTYYELGGVWGHDTFLLDVQNVGGAIRGFLH